MDGSCRRRGRECIDAHEGTALPPWLLHGQLAFNGAGETMDSFGGIFNVTMPVHVRSYLVVGSRREGSLENAYVAALRCLPGISVTHLDPELAVSWLPARVRARVGVRLQWRSAGNCLLSHLRGRPDAYDVVLVFKGMFLTLSTLRECRAVAARSLWVNLNPDDPCNAESRGAANQNTRETISEYDTYVTWTPTLLSSLRAGGAKCILSVPFGYDPSTHYPWPALDPDLAGSATFVGTWDREREDLLSHIADLPIRIFGWGWDRIGRRSPLRGKVFARNLYSADLRRVITSSRISVNMLRSQNAISHNMRTFEIPAMGGLMLTQRTTEQGAFFPEGAACLMYADPEELRSQVRTALYDLDLKDVRQAGLERVRGHSYRDRATVLHEALRDQRRQSG